MRSPPIFSVRRSENVSYADDVLVEQRSRTVVIGVVVRVDEVGHLVADIVGLSDLVDRPLDVASDGRRRVEENHAVLRG
jgi:hypothetical protein